MYVYAALKKVRDTADSRVFYKQQQIHILLTLTLTQRESSGGAGRYPKSVGHTHNAKYF